MIDSLPRREREIFEIICGAGEVSMAEIRERMADAPTVSAVRVFLLRLEERGLIAHRREGRQYIYRSIPDTQSVRKAFLGDLVGRLFRGSPTAAATMLMGMSEKISDEELDALEDMVAQARARKDADGSGEDSGGEDR